MPATHVTHALPGPQTPLSVRLPTPRQSKASLVRCSPDASPPVSPNTGGKQAFGTKLQGLGGFFAKGKPQGSTQTVVQAPSSCATTECRELLEPPTSFGSGDGGNSIIGGGGDITNRQTREGDQGGFPNPFEIIVAGVRDRLETDSEFAYKLLVECGLDASIIIGVNLAKRGKRFWKEAEFVGCQVCVSLLNDFALVYLLAPTSRTRAVAAGSLQAKIAALPAHMFQRAAPGMPGFTAAQRLGCFALKAVQYGTIGFVMGCTGTGIVHGLTNTREKLDPSSTPPPVTQSMLGTGLGWLIFMGLSSNVRYNTINAAEDFLYSSMSGAAPKLGSIGLRLANNVYSSYAWLELAKKLKLDRPRQAGQPQSEVINMVSLQQT